MGDQRDPLRVPTPDLSWPGATLRPWKHADAPALVAAWTEPSISDTSAVPDPADLATAQRWIAGTVERLDRRLAVDLVIETSGESAEQIVGEVGLSSFDDARRAAMIGYWLMPDARGRGLATSAVSEVTTWAFNELGLEHLIARCAPDNVASHNVVARAGYVHVAQDRSGFQLWRDSRVPRR